MRERPSTPNAALIIADRVAKRGVFENVLGLSVFFLSFLKKIFVHQATYLYAEVVKS
jgi:hypothetical protein